MEEQKNIVTPQSLKNGLSLKNEFRKEVADPYADIPEDELIARDQAVLLWELRLRDMVREINNGGIKKIIDAATKLRTEIEAMPMSPYRAVFIENLCNMIDRNRELLASNKQPIEAVITLLAFEQLFAEPEEVEAEEVTAKLSEDEETVPELADE